MRYSTPMLKQYNKYNSTYNVSVSDKNNLLKKRFATCIDFNFGC